MQIFRFKIAIWFSNAAVKDLQSGLFAKNVEKSYLIVIFNYWPFDLKLIKRPPIKVGPQRSEQLAKLMPEKMMWLQSAKPAGIASDVSLKPAIMMWPFSRTLYLSILTSKIPMIIGKFEFKFNELTELVVY